MDGSVLNAVGFASATIIITAVAALVVVRVLFSPSLADEIDDDLRNNHRG
jgi:multisubunit Na+/H+ antiporter MnhF subunit